MSSKKKISSIPRRATRLRATTSSDFVNAGRIVGIFGLRGECKIEATRLGADALGPGAVVHVRLTDGSERELRVCAARMHKGRPLAAFEGFDDASAAQALVGAELTIERVAVTLSAGEYLDVDLVGCRLIDRDGAALGPVVAVEHYPSQDMLVVGAARTLVPMVSAFVQSIDIAGRRIVVDLPPGLIDDRDAAADQG
jgi:16S rRNA processing protein RimM